MTNLPVSRRGLLLGTAGLAGGVATGLFTGSSARAADGAAAPSLLRSSWASITHGVQSGEVSSDGAVIWTRADQAARMFVQVSSTGDFRRTVRTVRGPQLQADSDFTGRVVLQGLPAGTDVHYRVVLGDPDDHRATGQSVTGSFVTAPSNGRRGRCADVRFQWSGDQSGQGWGRNPDLGGFPIFPAMLARDPQFFLHSGDSVYADGPITGDVTLPDGRIYRNVLSEAKSKVAETLDEFRGNYQYNFADANMQEFLARVPVIAQWDDHEVVNNWYPGEILTDPRYTEKSVEVLRARAYQAFREYQPVTPAVVRTGRLYRKVSYGPLLDIFVIDMRNHRDVNTTNDQPGAPSPQDGILGTEQAQWLVREMAKSKATWKVVQADMPIGLIVADGATDFEAVAQRDNGVPLGRERQIAWVLQQLKKRKVRNTVWLTADVHYTAAHYYDPAKAAFSDFDPFWEFVSGPLHAGGFGPNTLDGTFGPSAVFVAAPPRVNVSPLEGYQYFGEVRIDGDTEDLTVNLCDLSGTPLYSKTLPAA